MTPDELAAERDAEYWAPAFWCAACGFAEYVSTPDNGCTRCGHIEETS